MASPRIQVPASGEASTGNPILDSANAVDDSSTVITLEGNKPAQSSPLKSSTITAADLDTAYPESAIAGDGNPAASSSSSTSHSSRGLLHHDPSAEVETSQGGQEGTIENVLTAIGGAVATAPLAALEAISHKVPDVVETVKAHAPHLPQTTGTATSSDIKTDDLAHKATATGENLLHSAQNLVSQATNLAQQGVHTVVEKLPESVTSHLPTQITSIGEHKELPKAATGEQAFDFTAPHTTANFEASGSLQSTKNPELVEAQSDLAVKAESGDL